MCVSLFLYFSYLFLWMLNFFIVCEEASRSSILRKKKSFWKYESNPAAVFTGCYCFLDVTAHLHKSLYKLQSLYNPVYFMSMKLHLLPVRFSGTFAVTSTLLYTEHFILSCCCGEASSGLSRSYACYNSEKCIIISWGKPSFPATNLWAIIATPHSIKQ